MVGMKAKFQIDSFPLNLKESKEARRFVYMRVRAAYITRSRGLLLCFMVITESVCPFHGTSFDGDVS